MLLLNVVYVCVLLFVAMCWRVLSTVSVVRRRCGCGWVLVVVGVAHWLVGVAVVVLVCCC